MEPRELLKIVTVAEKLKDTTRHCYTANGRRESTAEHSWMTTLMAFFMRDEFPDVDMNKVITMCIVHDLGECFTGDIPAFDKTSADELKEKQLLDDWVKTLPGNYSAELKALYEEMDALSTPEAKVYKAIDNIEAVIQHNISDIDTWTPNEFELNLVYGNDKVGFSEYLTELRAEIRKDTLKKIAEDE